MEKSNITKIQLDLNYANPYEKAKTLYKNTEYFDNDMWDTLYSRGGSDIDTYLNVLSKQNKLPSINDISKKYKTYQYGDVDNKLDILSLESNKDILNAETTRKKRTEKTYDADGNEIGVNDLGEMTDYEYYAYEFEKYGTELENIAYRNQLEAEKANWGFFKTILGFVGDFALSIVNGVADTFDFLTNIFSTTIEAGALYLGEAASWVADKLGMPNSNVFKPNYTIEDVDKRFRDRFVDDKWFNLPHGVTGSKHDDTVYTNYSQKALDAFQTWKIENTYYGDAVTGEMTDFANMLTSITQLGGEMVGTAAIGGLGGVGKGYSTVNAAKTGTKLFRSGVFYTSMFQGRVADSIKKDIRNEHSTLEILGVNAAITATDYLISMGLDKVISTGMTTLRGSTGSVTALNKIDNPILRVFLAGMKEGTEEVLQDLTASFVGFLVDEASEYDNFYSQGFDPMTYVWSFIGGAIMGTVTSGIEAVNKFVKSNKAFNDVYFNSEINDEIIAKYDNDINVLLEQRVEIFSQYENTSNKIYDEKTDKYLSHGSSAYKNYYANKIKDIDDKLNKLKDQKRNYENEANTRLKHRKLEWENADKTQRKVIKKGLVGLINALSDIGNYEFAAKYNKGDIKTIGYFSSIIRSAVNSVGKLFDVAGEETVYNFNTVLTQMETKLNELNDNKILRKDVNLNELTLPLKIAANMAVKDIIDVISKFNVKKEIAKNIGDTVSEMATTTSKLDKTKPEKAKPSNMNVSIAAVWDGEEFKDSNGKPVEEIDATAKPVKKPVVSEQAVNTARVLKDQGIDVAITTANDEFGVTSNAILVPENRIDDAPEEIRKSAGLSKAVTGISASLPKAIKEELMNLYSLYTNGKLDTKVTFENVLRHILYSTDNGILAFFIQRSSKKLIPVFANLVNWISSETKKVINGPLDVDTMRALKAISDKVVSVVYKYASEYAQLDDASLNAIYNMTYVSNGPDGLTINKIDVAGFKEKRYNYLLGKKVIANPKNLTNDERRRLELRIENMFTLTKAEQDDFKNKLFGNVKNDRAIVINELNKHYDGIYYGKYDNETYLRPNGSPGVDAFNTFLQNNNLTVEKVLNSQNITKILKKFEVANPAYVVKVEDTIRVYSSGKVDNIITTKPTVKTGGEQYHELAVNSGYTIRTKLNDILKNNLNEFELDLLSINDILKSPDYYLSDNFLNTLSDKHQTTIITALNNKLLINDMMILPDSTGEYRLFNFVNLPSFVSTADANTYFGYTNGKYRDDVSAKYIDYIINKFNDNKFNGIAVLPISEFVSKQKLIGQLKDIKVFLSNKGDISYDSASNTIFVNISELQKEVNKFIEKNKNVKLVDINKYVYAESILHEFQHAIDTFNSFNRGMSDTKNIPTEIIDDIINHVEFVDKNKNKITITTDNKLKNASAFLYLNSGERGAFGAEAEILSPPNIVSIDNNGIRTVIFPWGSVVKIKGDTIIEFNGKKYVNIPKNLNKTNEQIMIKYLDNTVEEILSPDKYKDYVEKVKGTLPKIYGTNENLQSNYESPVGRILAKIFCEEELDYVDIDGDDILIQTSKNNMIANKIFIDFNNADDLFDFLGFNYDFWEKMIRSEKRDEFVYTLIDYLNIMVKSGARDYYINAINQDVLGNEKIQVMEYFTKHPEFKNILLKMSWMFYYSHLTYDEFLNMDMPFVRYQSFNSTIRDDGTFVSAALFDNLTRTSHFFTRHQFDTHLIVGTIKPKESIGMLIDAELHEIFIPTSYQNYTSHNVMATNSGAYKLYKVEHDFLDSNPIRLLKSDNVVPIDSLTNETIKRTLAIINEDGEVIADKNIPILSVFDVFKNKKRDKLFDSWHDKFLRGDEVYLVLKDYNWFMTYSVDDSEFYKYLTDNSIVAKADVTNNILYLNMPSKKFLINNLYNLLRNLEDSEDLDLDFNINVNGEFIQKNNIVTSLLLKSYNNNNNDFYGNLYSDLKSKYPNALLNTRDIFVENGLGSCILFPNVTPYLLKLDVDNDEMYKDVSKLSQYGVVLNVTSDTIYIYSELNNIDNLLYSINDLLWRNLFKFIDPETMENLVLYLNDTKMLYGDLRKLVDKLYIENRLTDYMESYTENGIKKERPAYKKIGTRRFDDIKTYNEAVNYVEKIDKAVIKSANKSFGTANDKYDYGLPNNILIDMKTGKYSKRNDAKYKTAKAIIRVKLQGDKTTQRKDVRRERGETYNNAPLSKKKAKGTLAEYYINNGRYKYYRGNFTRGMREFLYNVNVEKLSNSFGKYILDNQPTQDDMYAYLRDNYDKMNDYDFKIFKESFFPWSKFKSMTEVIDFIDVVPQLTALYGTMLHNELYDWLDYDLPDGLRTSEEYQNFINKMLNANPVLLERYSELYEAYPDDVDRGQLILSSLRHYDRTLSGAKYIGLNAKYQVISEWQQSRTEKKSEISIDQEVSRGKGDDKSTKLGDLIPANILNGDIKTLAVALRTKYTNDLLDKLSKKHEETLNRLEEQRNKLLRPYNKLKKEFVKAKETNDVATAKLIKSDAGKLKIELDKIDKFITTENKNYENNVKKLQQDNDDRISDIEEIWNDDQINYYIDDMMARFEMLEDIKEETELDLVTFINKMKTTKITNTSAKTSFVRYLNNNLYAITKDTIKYLPDELKQYITVNKNGTVNFDVEKATMRVDSKGKARIIAADDIINLHKLLKSSITEIRNIQKNNEYLRKEIDEYKNKNKKIRIENVEQKHELEKLNRELEKTKNKKVEVKITKERKVVYKTILPNVEKKIKSNTKIPDILYTLWSTEFSKTRKSRIKGIPDDAKVEDVVVSVNEFIDNNAKTLAELTLEDAVGIIEFYEGLHPIADLTDVEQSRITGMRELILGYVLLANKDKIISLSDEHVDRINKLIGSVNGIHDVSRRLKLWSEVLNKLKPWERINKELRKMYDVVLDDEDVEKLHEAIKLGDINKINIQLDYIRDKIYTDMKKDNEANKARYVANQILRYMRAAMLSGPNTIVRAKVSNVMIDGLNKLAKPTADFSINMLRKLKDGISSLSGGKIKTSYKGYRTGQVDLNEKLDMKKDPKNKNKFIGNDADIGNFVNTFVNESGIMDLISEHASKYDTMSGQNYSSDLSFLMVSKVISDVSKELSYDDKLLKPFKAIAKKLGIKQADEKIPDSFIAAVFAAQSDHKWIHKAFKKYFAILIKNDNLMGIINNAYKQNNPYSYLLSEKKFLDAVSQAYAQATYDYVHRGNFINDLMNSLRKKHPNLYIGTQFFMQFISGGFNWFMESLKYNPIGLLVSVTRFMRLDKEIQNAETKYEKYKLEGKGVKPGFNPRFVEYNIRNDLGKGIWGTIFFGVAMALSALGFISKDPDDDKYKLNFGGFYLDISNLYGAEPWLIGASIVDAMKSDDANILTVMDSAVNTTLENFFMTNLLERTKYNTSYIDQGADILFSTIGSFIPNFWKSLVRMTKREKMKYTSGILGDLEYLVYSTIPFLNWNKRIDPYTGDLEVRYSDSWLINIANEIGIFGGLKVKTNVPSDIEIAVRELGLDVGELKGDYEDIGKLNYNQLNAVYGKLNNEAITDFINNKIAYEVTDEKDENKKVILKYNKMTVKQKKQVIERIKRNNAKYAKIYVWTKDGHKYYTTSSERKTLQQLGITSNILLKNKNLEGFVN